MTNPKELAARRVAAIAELEAQLAGHVEAAQRSLLEGLLARLADIHADPGLLPALLQEYSATVLAPLAAFYGQSLLALPGLNVAYFQALNVPGYQTLRAPLADFLTARLGIDATGALVPGGYLSAVAGDTSVARSVLRYAYEAQASGTGINAYREGLHTLVTGGDAGAAGVVQTLYSNAADDFSRNDRQLQVLAGKHLGLKAFIYQGGLISGSRQFCIVRNGLVFLDSEIALFGTKEDAYGGYTNKSEGKFSGKTEPYQAAVDLGGFSCRHTLHGIPHVIALAMRPDLAENTKGELYIKPA